MKKSFARAALAGILLCVGTGALARAGADHPDIQGVWKIVVPTTTLKPIAGTVPFTDKGRKEYNDNTQMKMRGDYDDYDITTSRCSNPGVPRLMLTSQRFKIWDRQNFLTFDFEDNRLLRQIDVRGVKVERPIVPDMTGTSTGHWEGDTLVATTTDISERTLLDELLPHSIDMVVTERMKLIDRNTLEDRITITDPAYYSHPWEAVIRYKRQPDAVFREDVCLDRLPARASAGRS